MRSVRISAWVLAMLLTCSPLSALAVETDLAARPPGSS